MTLTKCVRRILEDLGETVTEEELGRRVAFLRDTIQRAKETGDTSDVIASINHASALLLAAKKDSDALEPLLHHLGKHFPGIQAMIDESDKAIAWAVSHLSKDTPIGIDCNLPLGTILPLQGEEVSAYLAGEKITKH